jgi:hypothetical protein
MRDRATMNERWGYAVGQDGALDLYQNGVGVGFLGRQFWYLRLGRPRRIRKGVFVTVLPGGAEVEERK